MTDRGIGLKRVRDLLGLTQEDFGALLGLKRITVMNWESGKAKPSAESWLAMARALAASSAEDALWCLVEAGVDALTLRIVSPLIEGLAKEIDQRAEAFRESIRGLSYSEQTIAIMAVGAAAERIREPRP